MSIAPPTRPSDHPDRFLDCQEAIESAFQALVDSALAAGWNEAEAVAAIMALADNHMLAMGENAALDRLLEALRRRGTS